VMMSLMLDCDAVLVGFVESDDTISLGKLALNAPRQLIVLGTPLKPMHFKPTSLISSAVSTDCFLSFDLSVARLYSSVRDSGEFIVMVAAVDNVSHAGVPTFFDEASCLNLSYTDRIRGVAGRVFGRANDAPISALSDDESFDIAMSSYVSMIQIQQQSQQDFVQLKADILY